MSVNNRRKLVWLKFFGTIPEYNIKDYRGKIECHHSKLVYDFYVRRIEKIGGVTWIGVECNDFRTKSLIFANIKRTFPIAVYTSGFRIAHVSTSFME